MRLLNYITLLGLLFPLQLMAQNVTGIVVNEKKEALVGANIYWAETSEGVFTKEDGSFTIPFKENINQLIISYIGYTPDTFNISMPESYFFEMTSNTALEEIVVSEEREGVIISDIKAIKTEQITEVELQKAACCDLAGCFETQATVQAQTTNIITNSKELRILGLSGVYNQILVDGFPQMQGLSYTYGISGIPGTSVKTIFVSKGANSVLQGYESISGQINVITKEPNNTDKLLFNPYINSFLEKQANLNYAIKRKKWSNLTVLHTTQPGSRRDKDEDNFLDLPLINRYMAANIWEFGQKNAIGWQSTIRLRFVNEKRVGGQVNYNADQHKGSSTVYGQTIAINQPELWAKTSFIPNLNNKFTFYASSFYQNQKSYFGTVKYDAQQTNIYSKIQHEWNYSKHNLKSGASLRYLNLNEDIAFTANTLQRTYNGNYKRKEVVPGVFAENTLNFYNDKFQWILGVRGDWHNDFGFQFTPRTLLKVDIAPKTIVRASIGTGWRTVNLFSENIGLLVSSRNIIFAETLNPEKALNTGINLTQKFENQNSALSGYLSVDFYRTDFENQIFPNYDTDPTKAIIKNFTGTSVSNGFQSELYLKMWKQIEFKLGYNFLDVYRMSNEIKTTLPFNSKHHLITTFSYEPLSNKWHFDANVHWYGKQRLPSTQSNPEAYQRPEFSNTFATLNAQFTYNFKQIQVYLGCENIFDYRQERPIISWENPFGRYFDTSSVWGPTKGREIYLGARYYVRK